MMNISNQIGFTMRNEVIVRDLNEKIRSLEERVEQLDSFSDTINHQMNIANELIAIMKEFPSGRSIYNRAVNRVKLNNLRFNVLERRKQALIELNNEKMPSTVKKSFLSKQIHLIQSTLKDINHREVFENRAAITVGTFLKNLEQHSMLNDLSQT
jgi:uncharacterized protein YeeX (DUF496 family)